MSPFSIPAYASDSTRAAIEAINQRIRQADSELASAHARADQARAADVMQSDVDEVLAAGNALRRARVDHLRSEIQARRDVDGVFQALAADAVAELRAAEEELMHCRRGVETGLRQLGLGHVLDQRDMFGGHPAEALVLSSTLVEPATRRYFAAKRAAQARSLRQANRQDLATARKRMKAEFEKAADGTPAMPSRQRVTLDPTCGLMSL